MHVRHGDFSTFCGPEVPEGECFAPLSAWRRGVEDVRTVLREEKGVDVQRVVITSDEKDAAWWAEVASFGWTAIDHTKLDTVARLGEWCVTLVLFASFLPLFFYFPRWLSSLRRDAADVGSFPICC